jgi:moderate conductance mechanosensitive channel
VCFARLALDPAAWLDETVDALTRDDVLDQLGAWAGDIGSAALSVVLIVIVAMVVLRLLRSAVQNIVERILDRQDQTPRELRQKAQTLASVIESAGRFIVFILAGMMILSSIGLEIAPLLASAGIAGLAIGLGAQSLIKDTINGFFILFENQYANGDVITIGEHSGSVEDVNLRRTILRSVTGAAIIIPNGEVRAVENQSKGWSRAVIDVETTANVDEPKIVALLHELLDNVRDDPEIGAFILEPPDILGINAVSVTGLTFRVLVKTEPLQQWKVERELRRRILVAFRAHGVPMPVLTSATIAPPVS